MKKIIGTLMLLLSVAVAHAFNDTDTDRIINAAGHLTEAECDSLEFIKKNNLEAALYLAGIINNDRAKIEQLDSICLLYKGQEKNMLYLTEEANIFTSPLPDSTEVSHAFRPLIKAIAKVRTYSDALSEMEDALARAKEDLSLRENRSKTFEDLLNGDSVQAALNSLIEANDVIEELDISIFSTEQQKYISDLQDQYNNIIITNFQ